MIDDSVRGGYRAVLRKDFTLLPGDASIGALQGRSQHGLGDRERSSGQRCRAHRCRRRRLWPCRL